MSGAVFSAEGEGLRWLRSPDAGQQCVLDDLHPLRAGVVSEVTQRSQASCKVALEVEAGERHEIAALKRDAFATVFEGNVFEGAFDEPAIINVNLDVSEGFAPVIRHCKFPCFPDDEDDGETRKESMIRGDEP